MVQLHLISRQQRTTTKGNEHEICVQTVIQKIQVFRKQHAAFCVVDVQLKSNAVVNGNRSDTVYADEMKPEQKQMNSALNRKKEISLFFILRNVTVAAVKNYYRK